MNRPEACYPYQAPIDAYGNGGFRFADMSHRGSILCLPTGIHGWEASDPEALTPGHFARVLDAKDGVNFLLLGTGERQVWPSPAIRRALAEASIALEVMDTGAAARTYNLLLAERRPVAAALILVA